MKTIATIIDQQPAEPAFDYAGLDDADRAAVERATMGIRDRIGRAAQNVVEIGARLLDVKERMGHGQFGRWLEAEFGWGHATAGKMMQVASKFPHCGNLKIATSALYLLASDAVSPAVRDAFIEQAKAGKDVKLRHVREAMTREEETAGLVAQAKASNETDALILKSRATKAERESRVAKPDTSNPDEAGVPDYTPAQAPRARDEADEFAAELVRSHQPEFLLRVVAGIERRLKAKGAA